MSPLPLTREMTRARTDASELLLGIIKALGAEGTHLHDVGDDQGAAQLAIACATLMDTQELLAGEDT